MPTPDWYEPNNAGVRELLKSQGVLDDLLERGIRVANAAGGLDDHQVDAEVGKNRARVAVITDTYEAKLNEARKRTLTRAVDAAR